MDELIDLSNKYDKELDELEEELLKEGICPYCGQKVNAQKLGLNKNQKKSKEE